MKNDDKDSQLRLLISLILSLVYFAAVSHFFGLSIDKVKDMKPNEIGDFFAGVFSPLAFFFLIIGYIQNTAALRLQGKELKISNESFRKQCEELKNSVEQQKALASTTEQELEHLKRQSEIELDIMLTNAQPFFHFSIDDAVKHDIDKERKFLISPNDALYKNFEFLYFKIIFTNSRTIARELQLRIECDSELRCTELYSIIDDKSKTITFTIENEKEKTNYLMDCNISLTFSYLDNLDLLQEQRFTLLLSEKNEPHLVAVRVRREPRNFRRF
ncbi:TPA: hypothetical protein MW256_003646 [Acinetobacter baumannii]|nr:hypothetical protein [Acinetobacter baumannii]